MQIQFSKMHGLGNDFMVIDQISQDVRLSPELVARLADRHTGVGFDQLLSVEPPTDPESDFRYRIYNADGSEAEQCGNGARCFAKFVVDSRLVGENGVAAADEHRRDHHATARRRQRGSRHGRADDGARRDSVRHQRSRQSRIASQSAIRKWMSSPCRSEIRTQCCSSIRSTTHRSQRSVPLLSRHERFPRGVNVGFCQVIDPGFARLRVFERGVGETRACGTGACAAAVAGVLTGRFSDRVKISLPGGKVKIKWEGAGRSLRMLGPACLVYEGRIDV